MAVHSAVFAGMPAIQSDLVSGFLLSALLLVALIVWRIRGVANETRWTIVALGLALSVLAAAAVSMTAFGNWGESFSLELFTQWGDWVMGRFALLAVIVGLIEIGRFHVDPDPGVPVPEYLPARG